MLTSDTPIRARIAELLTAGTPEAFSEIRNLLVELIEATQRCPDMAGELSDQGIAVEVKADRPILCFYPGDGSMPIELRLPAIAVLGRRIARITQEPERSPFELLAGIAAN